MGPETTELVKVLEELIALLRSDNEAHWANWMEQAQSRIVASDYSGIEKLLQAYGGMGSFNDLVLGYREESGTLARAKGREEMNVKLNELRTKAWELAGEIRHQQRQGA